MVGDTQLNRAQVRAMKKLVNNDADATIQAWTVHANHIWPGGIVPYEIDFFARKHL